MPRALVFSTLYPNAAQPNHGVFVENRLTHTLALGGLEATVLAPVPYFPSSSSVFGAYSVFARVPPGETRHGIQVLHPRYPIIPKIGSSLTPSFLFYAAKRAVKRLLRQGETFDVIDAHYVYPDGVAAAMLGRALGIPVMITARGTDVTLIPKFKIPRRQIQWAIGEASVGVAVCENLAERLIDLGAMPERTIALRNGVDLEQFCPGDRQIARARLRLKRFTLLSVGSLIPRKGHELVIEALSALPDCELVLVGEGPLRGELQRAADQFGVADRVRILGEVPHAELAEIYRAADVLVLASSREGWANVLLEAMACGTPVVATDVNGTGEVVRSTAAGRLICERSAGALISALASLRRSMPSRDQTREYACRFGWAPVAEANRALLRAVAEAGYRGRGGPGLADEARQILAQSGAAQ